MRESSRSLQVFIEMSNDRLLQRYLLKANLPFLSLLYPTKIPRITDITIHHRSGARFGDAPYLKLSAQRGKQLGETLGPDIEQGVRHV